MNKYHVMYKLDGAWCAFCMLAKSIYDAFDWAQANLQRSGVSVCKMEAH